MKTNQVKIYASLLVALVGGLVACGSSNQVTLQAKPWNHGSVHLWHDVRGDANSSFVNVADGASCTKVDGKTYQIGDGGPPIYYYKLTCNGSVGYVEIDQLR